jgi:NitT/TauT family transport system substrate-binding protein
MHDQRADGVSRREFLGKLTLMATAGLLGVRPGCATAEPLPETTRLRLAHNPGICIATYFLAKEFLPAEGFTDVKDVRTENNVAIKAVVAREVDIGMNFSGPLITRVDAGDPLVILAGIHVGCFQLFGGERVRAIRDLKGKTVALFNGLGGPEHVFLASMAAHVGVDPRQDIRWVTHPFDTSTQLLVEGRVDAVLAFPPQAQELRDRKVGQVVVNSLMDRPWSQYFCCMAYAHREFVRTHPVAIKRALRAFLKAAAVCSLEPERAARFLVDGGYTRSYVYALETMQDVGYNRWREYDAEDTIRFYALRLHEAGMIKSSPQKIIAQGTDWRVLNELKKELKG